MGLFFGSKQSRLLFNNAMCRLHSYYDMIGEIYGKVINIMNGSQGKLLKTKIYGKTTTNKSYQLFDADLFSIHSMGGATVTNNGDGSLTVTGSGKLTSTFSVIFIYSHDEVVRMFKSGEIHAKFGSITYPFVNLYLEDKPNGKSLKIAQNGWVANYDATITEEMLASPTTQLVVGLWGDTGYDIIPGTTKPMIYQDGDGTWEPFSSTNKSRQLFDESMIPTKTIGNVTVTNNGDGSFTVSGSGTLSETYIDLYRYSHEDTIKLLKPGAFYANFGAITYPCIMYSLENNVTNQSIRLAQNGWETSYTATITEDLLYAPDTQLILGFAGEAGATIISGTTKPMMYQQGDGKWRPFAGVDGTSALESIGNDEGNVEVTVKSPQLFDTSKIPSFSQGGATITNNGDGSFTITGSGNLTSDVGKDFRFSHDETIKLLKAGNLHSNYSSTSNPYLTFYLVNGGWNVVHTFDNYSTTQITQVITENMLSKQNLELLVAIYGDAGTPIRPATVKPMIYQDGDGEWQPFDSQSHIASVGNGLKGIPLNTFVPDVIANNPLYMQGVYFDDNQYWIADTVDYGKGTLIRRIIEKTYDGTTSIAQGGNNTSVFFFEVGNDVNIIANSEVPIQTDQYKYVAKHFDSLSNGECTLFVTDSRKLVYLCNTNCSSASEMESLLAENPLTVQYVLQTPVETAISGSEITSFNELHSYNGTTIISNDCDACMSTQYFKN